MAKNWSAAEAARVVYEGKDKAAIMDIGKRFPLFVAAASRGTEGLLEIIGALHPDRITARTIESKLKEGVGEYEEDEDATEDKPAAKKAPAKTTATKGRGRSKAAVEEDEDEEEEAPKKPTRGRGKAASKAKPEPEEDEDDEDFEDDEDEIDYEELSLTELRKEAKRQKINVAGMKRDQIIAALRGEDDDEEDEDDDDDWDI